MTLAHTKEARRNTRAHRSPFHPFALGRAARGTDSSQGPTEGPRDPIDYRAPCDRRRPAAARDTAFEAAPAPPAGLGAPTHQGGRGSELGASEHLRGRRPGGQQSGVSAEKGEKVRRSRRQTKEAMIADTPAIPLTRSGCRTSDPTDWDFCAQARRGRRQAPGCSAAEGGGPRRQGHFVSALLAAVGAA